MGNQHLVVGTAGHIDHGKTTLVRALTGVETDRLSEEQRRGITIVLGFAPLTLPDGREVGVVDVPGHEKFVRTMVAGAGGVDVGLLVVSAEEGVMPQTREHAEILAMLRVPELVVALTRADEVDEDLLELAALDAAELLADTPWPAAVVVPCSGLTGQGIDDVKEELMAAANRLPEPPAAAEPVFRLPIDRSFVIKGFGTVVTGTSRSGVLAAGDTVEVLPGRARVKVRGVQVHGEAVDSVGRGLRTALNLQGVDAGSVPAGAWLATPGALAAGDRFDVEIELLPTATPLANNTTVRFLVGTAEVLATVRLLDADGGPAPDELLAGATGLAQLALKEPCAAVAGDRFVLRRESPMRTLGGGRILDPEPVLLRRRGRAAAAALLQVLRSDAAPAARVAALLRRDPTVPLDRAALRRRLPPLADGVVAAASAAVAAGDAVALTTDPPSWASTELVRRWRDPALAAVDAHHEAHPLLDGPSRSELRHALVPVPDARTLDALLPVLLAATGLELRRTRVARPAHSTDPGPEAAAVLDTFLGRLEAGGTHPPPLSEAASGLELPPDALAWLIDRGRLVRVADDFLVAQAPYRDLVTRVVEHTRASDLLTPQAFKELSGLSRRHAMPFLEFLDRERITQRTEGGRVLRDPPEWVGVRC